MAKEESSRVRLYEKRGETSRFIDAEITKDGGLVMTGQDVGKAPKEQWGDSDYEFWVRVPADQKDAAILALLQTVYGGNASAVDDFRDLLESRDIHSEFGTWT